MKKKSTDPRKPRGYKAKDLPYTKAVRRARKDHDFLTNILETVVDYYSRGYKVYVEDVWGNKQLITYDKSKIIE